MEIKQELRPYVPLAQMLVQTLGPDCEVVLHDLDTPAHSVVYVENPSVTGRKVGESFDQLVRQVILSDDLKENFVANYYFTAPNGKYIRSSSLLIKDARGNLTGAMCINLDTTRITQQMAFLQSLMPKPPEPVAAHETQHGNRVEDMVMSLVDNILAGCDVRLLTREERLEKIRFMQKRGIFQVKGSIEQVAKRLGITKVTVYSYLDELRKKSQDADD